MPVELLVGLGGVAVMVTSADATAVLEFRVAVTLRAVDPAAEPAVKVTELPEVELRVPRSLLSDQT